jgi:hypothetical protein
MHLKGRNRHNLFSCSLKNSGSTPARIAEIAVRYCKVTTLRDVPEKPDYGPRTPLNGLPLVKDESIDFGVFLRPNPILSKEEHDAVRCQKAFLYAFGLVIYRDVYNRLHNTKFGYVYHFPQGDDARSIGFRREGLPPAYNGAT